MPNWSKHQSLDQLENKKEYMRTYMQEYREKQKQLISRATLQMEEWNESSLSLFDTMDNFGQVTLKELGIKVETSILQMKLTNIPIQITQKIIPIQYKMRRCYKN